MLFRWNFWWKKANTLEEVFASLSNAITKFFLRPSLMWRGGSNILLGSARRWDREMCNQVLILVLMVTLVWHNAGHQHDNPISTESMHTLPRHPEVLGWVQQLCNLHRVTIYVSGSSEHNKRSMLLWDSFISSESATRDGNLFSLFRGTVLRLLLDETIKSLHSIASYVRPCNSIRSKILLQ